MVIGHGLYREVVLIKGGLNRQVLLYSQIISLTTVEVKVLEIEISHFSIVTLSG